MQRSSGNTGRVAELAGLTRAELESRLGTSPSGLSSAEAERRALAQRSYALVPRVGASRWRCLRSQLKSPLTLMLMFAASASALAGGWLDAGIVLAILLASIAISYTREYRAQSAAAALSARVQVQIAVVRDGVRRSIPLHDVVSGDVFELQAGSLVPADACVVEANACFVNEAVITGESFPAEKRAEPLPGAGNVEPRTRCVFLGTHVRSGTARCIAVETGLRTQFGTIAQRLSERAPETGFDRGIRHFGYLLSSAMLIMVLLVFAANMLLERPALETLLFSIALAVGLSPELLPAILSVNLARGARRMADAGVLVKRLNAIEDLGSMDVLCTDKTGTLTEGVVCLEGAFDGAGKPSARVLELARTNARLQGGLRNPLDEALSQDDPAAGGAERLGEVPYDFVRKRLSVVVRQESGEALIITKGAFEAVLAVCASSDAGPLDDAQRARLRQRYEAWSAQGTRVLALATRVLSGGREYGREDESALCFVGFLTFVDRPKESAAAALGDLRALGVSVKVISGDSRLVCQHVAQQIGLDATRVVAGSELDELHEGALWHTVEQTQVFAEVDPAQKERIILSLKRLGHVVGFMGDGINDAPAMHAADTSLSVEKAADVAKQAADFVLLERDLQVIRRGIEEGRKTFANTLKYVLMTTSANLGNMISMAVASVLLPFLPLLASQVLLNNFLSDIPAIGLANDSVDPELVDRPQRWDMRFIGRFMLTFGGLSSCFDLITFALLLWLFGAQAAQFQTGWFFESLLTELLVALVVRTRRPFYRSRPSRMLWMSSALLVLLAYVLPYLPGTSAFGFVALPLEVIATLTGVTLFYVLGTELLKAGFYRRTRPARELQYLAP